MDLQEKATKKPQYSRKNVSINLADYEKHLKNQTSQREAAKVLEIPRSTLRHWKARKDSMNLPLITINFFESPEGAAFIHQMVTALLLVMVEVGGCGIRLASQFLRLCGLNHFISTSYEALRNHVVKLEQLTVSFGKEEGERLAATMKKRKISIAEDETFHPKPCLVAIDLESNFILLEKYSDKRDASAWNTAMDDALSGLDVEVIQCASDEAKGIVAHVQNHLGAQHSPDIFHVQQEISKGGSRAIATKVKSAESQLHKAESDLQKFKQLKELPPEGRGRRPEILKQSLPELEKQKDIAEDEVKRCKEQQEKFTKAKREISRVYHPYDLDTGQVITEQQLEQSLNKEFDKIEAVMAAMDLKSNGIKKIEKAKRVTPDLVKTLKFFWVSVGTLLKTMNLTASLERIMKELVIPAEYLMIAARKGKDSKTRKEIINTAETLLQELNTDKTWLKLKDEERAQYRKTAKEAAAYFQRSSSCVEGRNGYLSLYHHELHHLSDRKLNTLTVLHNYFIQRQDGSTPAERFFLNKQQNLFEYLVERMPYPGRPRKSRKYLKEVA